MSSFLEYQGPVLQGPTLDSAPESPVLGAPWAFQPRGPYWAYAIEKAKKWRLWLLTKNDVFSKLDRHLFSHCENPEMSGPRPPQLDAGYYAFPKLPAATLPGTTPGTMAGGGLLC